MVLLSDYNFHCIGSFIVLSRLFINSMLVSKFNEVERKVCISKKIDAKW